MSNKSPLGITELALRDAHQSLLATRMRIDDMLPIAGKHQRQSLVDQLVMHILSL